MDQDIADRLWNELEQEIHDDLRVVTVYRRIDHVTRLRDDLRDEYTSDVHQRLADENIVDWHSEERLKRVLGAGPLEAVIRLYPEFCLVAKSPPGEKDRGILASVEPPTDAGEMGYVYDVVEFLDGLDWDFLD